MLAINRLKKVLVKIKRTTFNTPFEFTIINFGRIEDNLKIQDFTLNDPQREEITCKITSFPIFPTDLENISGWNSGRIRIPFTPGTAAVGTIEKIGNDVKQFQIDDRVLIPYTSGTWKNNLTINSKAAVYLNKNISDDQAVLLPYSPLIAYHILSNIVQINSDDVIIQSNAESAIGLSIVQLCRKMKIKTINIVSNNSDYTQSFRIISNNGGTIICNEEYSKSYKFRELVGTMKKPKIGVSLLPSSISREIQRNIAEGGFFITNQLKDEKSILLQKKKAINFNIQEYWENTEQKEIVKIMKKLIALVETNSLVSYGKRFTISDLTSRLDELNCLNSYRFPVIFIN